MDLVVCFCVANYYHQIQCKSPVYLSSCAALSTGPFFLTCQIPDLTQSAYPKKNTNLNQSTNPEWCQNSQMILVLTKNEYWQFLKQWQITLFETTYKKVTRIRPNPVDRFWPVSRPDSSTTLVWCCIEAQAFPIFIFSCELLWNLQSVSDNHTYKVQTCVGNIHYTPVTVMLTFSCKSSELVIWIIRWSCALFIIIQLGCM